MPASDRQLAQVRSFNRFFSERMGILDKTPYDPELNLLESRIVFELHERGETLAKELAARLTVDKGYLSRVLGTLQKKGLVRLRERPTDRRQKWLALTPSGAKMFRRIDRASDERTRALLGSVDAMNAAAAVEHLSTAQLALGAGGLTPKDVVLRNLEPGDLGWVIGRHGDVYAGEFGWNQEFEILVADIALTFAKKHDAERERAFIAVAGGVRLGCVFLVKDNARTAKLRILLVEPFARGLGLGRRLVAECVAFARKAGYARVVLWTNDVLIAARKIYQEAGFVLEKEEAHVSFGKKLTGQYWAKSLSERCAS